MRHLFTLLPTLLLAAPLVAQGGSVAVRAGRIMLKQITDRVEKGRNFAIETTLSGRSYARAIPKWRAAGYEITIYFLSLPHRQLSVVRVATRVSHGGHHIPEDVIRRRFDTGLNNFYTLYRDLVDYWFLYDNSVIPAKLIDTGRL